MEKDSRRGKLGSQRKVSMRILARLDWPSWFCDGEAAEAISMEAAKFKPPTVDVIGLNLTPHAWTNESDGTQ